MKMIRYNEPVLAPWSGFGRFPSVGSAFDDLFESAFGGKAGLGVWSGDWSPAVDVHQTDDAIEVVAELPGMKREEIALSLEEGALVISGERKLEKEHDESRTFRSERFHGQFKRVIQLPVDVDASRITATYKDGELRVTLPVAEEAKPKKITVAVEE